MLTENIALVDTTRELSPSDLTTTAAALQKQATRDLAPIWGVSANVSYFPHLKDVPVGYWPIIIKKKLDDPNAGGYHEDKNHQPFSLILMDDSWQLTCSHEMCEMLVDPYGNKLTTSNGIQDPATRVQYLVEVCDPCEDASCAYSVNGILLSDFITPNFYDPVTNSATRYSFTGAVTAPRQIKKNGYISWLDPTSNKWYQATFFGESIEVKELVAMEHSTGSLRSRMDGMTQNTNKLIALTAAKTAHKTAHDNTFAAAVDKASRWEAEIAKY